MATRRIPWLPLELDAQVLVSDFQLLCFPSLFVGVSFPYRSTQTKTINRVSGEGNGENSMGNALGKERPLELVWAPPAVPAGGESVSDDLDTAANG